MKRASFAVVCSLAVMVLAAGFLLAGDAAKAVTTQGFITDSYCGAKNATMEGKACALKCMEKGAKLVLYSSTDKKTFNLDDQTKAKENVGFEVSVTGTVDEATSSIKVAKIEPAPKKG
jgi:hypothetical protein